MQRLILDISLPKKITIDLTIMLQSNNSGRRSISGKISSFVNDRGAGSRVSVTATSPDGQTRTRNDDVFTPGATSSSVSVQGNA